MSDYEFPSLSVNPDADAWQEAPAVTPTLSSPMESGAVHTRPRFTKVPRKWDVLYRDVSLADKLILEEFERLVGYGGAEFNWTNPLTGELCFVRFAQPLSFRVEPENPAEWQVSIQLVEKL